MSEHHKKPPRRKQAREVEPEPGVPPVTNKRIRHRKREPLPEQRDRFRTR